MLSIHESKTLDEAGQDLLGFILEASHWIALERLGSAGEVRPPGQNADYQRQVGKLSICASVDVTRELGVFLRIAFRAPGLTPTKAADHLEEFLKSTLPLRPNTEWQVQVDSKRWVHFIRKLVGTPLEA